MESSLATASGTDEGGFWSRNRALLTIMLVNFVSLAGFGLMFPVFAIYGRQIGATGWEISGAVAAFSFGQFLSSPLWGRLSDIHGRRPVLIAGLVLGAVVYVFHIYAHTPGTLLFARFVSGLATGSFSVAFAVASDISTRETRTRVMGIVSAGFSLGFIFGPAIGGVAASLTSENNAFMLVCIVGAALGLVAAGMTWALLPETHVDRHLTAQSKHSSRSLLRSPALAAPVVVSFFVSAGFSKMESILGLFADDVLGLKPFGIGLMFGGMGMISSITQLLLTGRMVVALGERGLLLMSLGIIGVGLFILGLASDVSMAAAGLLCTSIGFAFVNPALTGLTSLATPANAQGSGLGLMQASNALGRVAGPAVAGILYDIQGPSSPLFWASGIFLITLILAPFAPLAKGRGA